MPNHTLYNCLPLLLASSVACGGGANQKSTTPVAEQAQDLAEANHSDDESWGHDVDRAAKIAKADNKDILFFFTGSDWCGPCKMLHNEVFSKKGFYTYAKKNFVLVELDFPTENVPLSDEQKEHNEKWRKKFKVEGFPTVILTDAAKQRYSTTMPMGGGEKGFTDFLSKQRDGRKERDQLLAKAKKAQGVEKARALDKALSIDGLFTEERGQLIEELLASADEAPKLQKKYKVLSRDIEIAESLDSVGTKVFSQEPGVGWSKSQATLKSGLKDIKKLEKKYDLTQLPGGEIIEEYFTLKSGIVSRIDGRRDEGLQVLRDAFDNEDYKVEFRQTMGSLLAEFYAEFIGMDAFSDMYDEAIALAPDSSEGEEMQSYRYHMTRNLQRRFGGRLL